jgi:hypothetical protein
MKYTTLDDLNQMIIDLDAKQDKLEKTLRWKYWLKYYYPTLRFLKERKGYRDRLIQRFRYGISYRDAWDLNYFLSNAIWRGTNQLIEEGICEHPPAIYLIRAGFDVWINVDEYDWTPNQRLLIKDAQRALGEHFEELWD